MLVESRPVKAIDSLGAGTCRLPMKPLQPLIPRVSVVAMHAVLNANVANPNNRNNAIGNDRVGRMRTRALA